MKPTILFVDDEENILSSLVRLFRKENYDLLTATGGKDGLKIVESREISLVISDQMMPVMTGVDFLTRVKDISPDTIRIMLTGYADLEAAISAINKGEVYRFISKPWNDEELKLTVRQSLDYRDLVLKNRSLTRTVKKQYDVLKTLEKDYPGISTVSRSEDGAILIDEDALEDFSIDELLNPKG
ncbi:MAG: response regulator receiver protein [Deltaproteobacteria bacterium]|nr:response regulator receiver protein [Deltaproteobacteria bacterium]